MPAPRVPGRGPARGTAVRRAAVLPRVASQRPWRRPPTPAVLGVAERGLRRRGAGRDAIPQRTAACAGPAAVDMESGDVLVAHTTDPSWASVMYPAGALVVEIGGQLSHAAVVARELGIPCVMGVADATRGIRDGDLVRVDGGTGTVEILQ